MNVKIVVTSKNEDFLMGEDKFVAKGSNVDLLLVKNNKKPLAKLYNVTMEDGDMEAWYNVIAKVNEYGSDVDYEFYKNSMGDSYVYDNARNYKILTEAMKHVKVIYTNENETTESGG